jgi:hypothetical protein
LIILNVQPSVEIVGACELNPKEPILKKGSFCRVLYSDDKQYSDSTGEISLTKDYLYLQSKAGWTCELIFDNLNVIEEKDYLIIQKILGGIILKLSVDNAKSWAEATKQLALKKMEIQQVELELSFLSTPMQFNDLLNFNQASILKMYTKKRRRLTEKNAEFNLKIISSLRNLENKWLKAYITAHSFATWYEWTIDSLKDIYKYKNGKKPKNDEELLAYMNQFPRLKPFNNFTKQIGINANQIRKCVAKEKYYFDYKSNELIFRNRKEFKVALKDFETLIVLLANFNKELEFYLKEIALNGKIENSMLDDSTELNYEESYSRLIESIKEKKTKA